MTFAEAVDEESKILFCQSLQRISVNALYLNHERLIYLVKKTAKTQANQPSFSNWCFVAPYSWHNQVIEHSNEVNILLQTSLYVFKHALGNM